MTTASTRSTRLRMPIDNWLFGATLALLVVGLWMVFDTSYVKSLDSAKLGYNAFFFVKRQAFGVIVGLVALFTAMRFGYWNLRRFAVPLMLMTLVLLCAVWIPGIGRTENYAARWIAYKGINFQPSEMAKIALVIYLAALLSRPHCKVRRLGEGLGPPLFVTGITLLLIEREPDMGTAIVLFLAALTQMFLAGARKRHLLLILIVAGLLGSLMVFGFGHRPARMVAFLNPEQYKEGIGYQIYRSLLAIGSGGWFGVGFGQGREKYFIPQRESDFVFATLAEEMGFVRTVGVMLLLLLVGWRGFRIALNTKDPFGALLAAGIASVVSWQALLNIAVATASIPTTGVPLPFISYGSSSLVFLLLGVGILLNIAQHPTPPSASEK